MSWIEAAIHASRSPRDRERYQRTKRRLGRRRGSEVARFELARDLASATPMLTRQEPFRAAGLVNVRPE